MKHGHLPLKKVLQKKLKDPQFRLYFQESRAVSELCDAVTRARLARGISQTELAKKVETSQSVIARLEKGNNSSMPSLDLLSRIANALGLSLVVGFEGRVAPTSETSYECFSSSCTSLLSLVSACASVFHSKQGPVKHQA